MPIDWSLFRFGKGSPRVLVKRAKDTAHDRKLAKAYKAVNLREDNRCQVTGVNLTPGALDEKRRREHHHLKGRNVRPEWVYRSERIILVSKFIHDLLTANAIIPDGCDARKPIKFSWNRNIVRAGHEPIRIPARVRAEAA